MMIRAWIWSLAVAIMAAVVTIDAQSKPPVTPTNASANVSPSLPADLAHEIADQQRDEQLAQAINDLTALRVQFSALSKALDELLAVEANPRIKAVVDKRKAIEARAIAALGGDPEKDGFDWATKTVKKGGKP